MLVTITQRAIGMFNVAKTDLFGTEGELFA